MATVTMIKKIYDGEWALQNVLSYCYRSYHYTGRYGINGDTIENACREMLSIKKKFEKTGGNQLHRIVITVENLRDENGNRLTDQLADRGSFIRSIPEYISTNIGRAGFQNCYFTNVIDDTYIQFHFVINTVSYLDGSLICELKELQEMVFQEMITLYPQFQWKKNYISG